MASRRRPAVCLLLCGLAAAGCGTHSPENEIETRLDVVFCSAGERALRLDVVRPISGRGCFPGVVVIHGGSWDSGSKADVRQVLTLLARRGYVAIAPDYRLSTTAPFPVQVHDVKAAVRWARENAARLRLDGEHVGTLGFSAGGHLALLLGVTAPSDELEGDAGPSHPSTRVQAVVSFFGPTDLTRSPYPGPLGPAIKGLLGTDLSGKPVPGERASPIRYLSPDDPPILSFQGTRDPIVPYTDAIEFAAAMSRSGVSGHVELISPLGHGWCGDDSRASMMSTVLFLDRYLKPRMIHAR